MRQGQRVWRFLMAAGVIVQYAVVSLALIVLVHARLVEFWFNLSLSTQKEIYSLLETHDIGI